MATSKLPSPLSLDQAITITKIDASIYKAEADPSYCIGIVPHGGYVASLFLKVASTHLAARNQPHTISAHWTYLNRTREGRMIFRVVEAKLGWTTSVLHISLYQHGILEKSPWIPKNSQPIVGAYITNGNLGNESGITLPTGWGLEHAPPPVDLTRLASGNDPNWWEMDIPFSRRMRVMSKLQYYVRRSGHALPTIQDYWTRLPNGERFTQESLGFLADCGPPLLIEAFRPSGPGEPIPEGGFPFETVFWYPTLTMTLDFRRKLPEEGVEWVMMRVVGKEVRNGRYDAEVLIFDERGEFLASSNHVAMVVDIKRNYGGKGKRQEKM